MGWNCGTKCYGRNGCQRKCDGGMVAIERSVQPSCFAPQKEAYIAGHSTSCFAAVAYRNFGGPRAMTRLGLMFFEGGASFCYPQFSTSGKHSE